jgi:ParG
MPQPARLTGSLLARKGQAVPAVGFPTRAAGLLRSGRLEVIGGRSEPGVPATRRRPGEASQRRIAMTVRLDRERHIRLKVFAALHGRSCQDVLIQALDAWLEACGADCACLSCRGTRPANP